MARIASIDFMIAFSKTARYFRPCPVQAIGRGLLGDGIRRGDFVLNSKRFQPRRELH